MRSAAEVAALYGVLFIPKDVSAEHAMLGLLANSNRVRARQILDSARSISVVMSENDNGRDLMKACGMTDRDIQKTEIDRWLASRKE